MANIQHWLDQIRRAIYGREVRSSIADAIEAINKDCEGTGIKQEQLEQTFDQLIINAGNSNAEIVAARVDKKGQQHQTLGDRLNATDDAVEKNAEKITDLEKEIERIDNRFSNIYYLADYIEDTNITNIVSENIANFESYKKPIFNLTIKASYALAVKGFTNKIKQQESKYNLYWYKIVEQ